MKVKAHHEVGKRIRALRHDKKLSLNDLCNKTGFSKGFLSKVERGLSSPPIATLMTIAGSLEVRVGDLFNGSHPEGPQTAVFTRAADRELVNDGAERGYTYERLAVGSPFALAPYIMQLEEGVSENLFQHGGEEVVFMLCGEMDYIVGGETYHIEEGDTLVFDARKLHGPRKIPGKPAKFLAIFSESPLNR